MRTSNPPSYDNIFSIYAGSGTLSIDTDVAAHRGLLIVNSSASAITTAVVVKNIETRQTVTLAIAPGATLLPLQVQSVGIGTQNTNIFIYGLR